MPLLRKSGRRMLARWPGLAIQPATALRAKAVQSNPLYATLYSNAVTAYNNDNAIWSWSCNGGSGLPNSDQTQSFKGFPIMVIKRTRHGVEDDIMLGRIMLCQRSDGHQTARTLASLSDKIRLPAGGPQISAGKNFTRGPIRGSGKHRQMVARLNNRVLQTREIIFRVRLTRPNLRL